MTFADPPRPPKREPVALFFGWLLMVVGALVTLLCGGCTVVVWVIAFSGGLGGPGQLGAILNMIAISLVIGGVPTLIGMVLIWAGWRLTRPPVPSPKQVSDTFQ